MCEVVSTVANMEREELRRVRVKQALSAIFQLDEDGMVSKSEFEKKMEKQDSWKELKKMKLDSAELLSFSEIIFASDHTAGHDNRISLHSFAEEVVRLQGDQSAKVEDIMELRRLIRKTSRECCNELRQFVTESLHGSSGNQAPGRRELERARS